MKYYHPTWKPARYSKFIPRYLCLTHLRADGVPEAVEVGSPGHVAPLPIVVVATQAVLPSPRDVRGNQVPAERSGAVEHLVAYLRAGEGGGRQANVYG